MIFEVNCSEGKRPKSTADESESNESSQIEGCCESWTKTAFLQLVSMAAIAKRKHSGLLMILLPLIFTFGMLEFGWQQRVGHYYGAALLTPLESHATFWQPQEYFAGTTTANQVVNQNVSYKVDSTEQKQGSSADFQWDKSTEENYRDLHARPSGKFAHLRKGLDFDYHSMYNLERQALQDDIMESMLEQTWLVDDGKICNVPKRNWILFTAGVMGAGKTHTTRLLEEKGRFPLHSFVSVDPDEIRRSLPEFDEYIRRSPQLAGHYTRKEAGMMAEMITEASLQRGQNVLVDGSLRDAQWYQEHFLNLRERYPNVQIGILHVTAPREAVLKRAESRAKITGRIVPLDLLEKTMKEVPKSVAILRKHVDYYVEVHNAPNSQDVELMTPGITWESFRQTWTQSCAFNLTTTSEVEATGYMGK